MKRLDPAIAAQRPKNPPVFSGSLDSELVTHNGGTMTLHVLSCPPLSIGDKIKIAVEIKELDRFFNENNELIDENSEDDLLATFDGYLERTGKNKFVFSEMQRRNEIDWVKASGYPWFFVAFAGENDSITNSSQVAEGTPLFEVVVGKNDESSEGDEFEIGFVLRKEDGSVLGTSGRTMSRFRGEYSYDVPLIMFDTGTRLHDISLSMVSTDLFNLAGNDANASDVSYVHSASQTAFREKNFEAVEKALKTIENLVKTSKNPWFQHIEAVNQYYQKLEMYKSQLSAYNEALKNNKNEYYARAPQRETELKQRADELKELEEQIHQYLSSGYPPPAQYRKQIEENMRIIKMHDDIENILNDPMVQIMGILPGAGVVTGTLKLIQGKTYDGLFDIFGSIVTYGSFFKLARVARVYRSVKKDTVKLLYNYRYRNLVSRITTTDAMKKITEVSMKQSSKVLGGIFDTIDSFSALRGCVDDIALLQKNNAYIKRMAKGAIQRIKFGDGFRNADEFLEYLNDLRDANCACTFFSWIRLIHATAKVQKDVYSVTQDAMKELQTLLNNSDVPGTKEFDRELVDNISELFELLPSTRIKMDEVIDKQSAKYRDTSAIIADINNLLAERDTFGVNLNADIRHQNTRLEMVQALKEIEALWEQEKSKRDQWVTRERNGYFSNLNDEAFWMRWVRTPGEGKTGFGIGLPESLETRVENFRNKLLGQIELAEKADEKRARYLGWLNKYCKKVTFPLDVVRDRRGNEWGPVSAIYDINIAAFRDEAMQLIDDFYGKDN